MTANIPKTSETKVKNPLEPVHGVLLLNKSFGLSSNTALQRARHLLRAQKAGHTGTLDPHATGLLPLCLGEATKFSQWILEAPKGYMATLKLGMVSTTLDGEGELTVTSTQPVDATRIDEVLTKFLGAQQQIPPMHAAIKVGGKALYDYARSGQEVVRAPRAIEIYRCQRRELEGDLLTIECHVSKGTYIRVLASDIGQALGCGAYLYALNRTYTGPYHLDQAVTLEELMALTEVQRRQRLLPVDSLLQGVPLISLVQDKAQSLQQGRVVILEMPPVAGLYRVYNEESCFIGLCELSQTGRLRPLRLMATSL